MIVIYNTITFIKDNFHVIPLEIIHSRKHACGQNVSIFLNNNTITCTFMGEDVNLTLTLIIPVAKSKVMDVVHNLYLTQQKICSIQNNYEHGLLSCNTIQFRDNLVFQRNMLPQAS
jgi:hypothetical protein